MNVILLVNLAWSAVLLLRFLRGRGPFASLERWRTDYLAAYAAWAAIVAIAFPPAFVVSADRTTSRPARLVGRPAAPDHAAAAGRVDMQVPIRTYSRR